MSAFVRNIPNLLTLFRLALIPIFVILLIDPNRSMVAVAIVIFIIAAATDFIDGIIARRFGAVSDAGKLLDPLADKILVMAALVMLVGQRSDLDGAPWVPSWLVVLILAREIWVTGLRGIAASRGMVVQASSSGKFKSGFQMIAIVLLLLHESKLRVLGVNLSCQVVGVNLLLLSVLLSYWSAVEYSMLVLNEALQGSASLDQGSVGQGDGRADHRVN